MMRAFLTAAGAAALLVLGPAPQASAAVIATLTFDEPSATVANNVSIPVWVTLALDAGSDPLKTDPSGNVTSPDPSTLFTDHPDITRVILNNSFECSGTFVTGCNQPTDDYNFHFNFGAASFVAPSNLDLGPGSSTHFLFGSFDPQNGATHAGTYTFYDAIFEFEGNSPDFKDIRFNTIAQTCPGQDNACAFTRTVFEAVPPGTGAPAAAFPEPAAWALMILGFAGAGAPSAPDPDLPTRGLR
jgi:hypothetical protein